METYWPYLNKGIFLISVSKRLFFRPLALGTWIWKWCLVICFWKEEVKLIWGHDYWDSVMALSYLNEIKLHNLVFQALLWKILQKKEKEKRWFRQHPFSSRLLGLTEVYCRLLILTDLTPQKLFREFLHSFLFIFSHIKLQQSFYSDNLKSQIFSLLCLSIVTEDVYYNWAKRRVGFGWQPNRRNSVVNIYLFSKLEAASLKG